MYTRSLLAALTAVLGLALSPFSAFAQQYSLPLAHDARHYAIGDGGIANATDPTVERNTAADIASRFQMTGNAESFERYSGPRAGVMYGVVSLGAEWQRGHYGHFVGYVLPFGIALGTTYYSNPRHEAWYAGPFFWYGKDEIEELWVIGLSGGYRFHFDSGWEIALGAGVGYAEWPEWPSRKAGLIVPTLSIGYLSK